MLLLTMGVGLQTVFDSTGNGWTNECRYTSVNASHREPGVTGQYWSLDSYPGVPGKIWFDDVEFIPLII